MAKDGTRRRNTKRARRRPSIPPARLSSMIEEAIVDAYTEAEQAAGFHATIEQHLAVPFETVVLGAGVTVKRIGITTAGEVVAVCYRGRERQAIPLLELPLPDPPPTGWVWIEAYRRWALGRW